jgi:hypothetical protein
MMWFIAVTITNYLDIASTYDLEALYENFSECHRTLEFLQDKMSAYWPNPEANVKSITMQCLTERPFGD